MPTGLASYLPDEPTTLHKAKVSPEWPQWRDALKREMDGQIARGVWKVVDRPKGRTVLGTKTVFKREVDQDGRVESRSAASWPRVSARSRGFITKSHRHRHLHSRAS